MIDLPHSLDAERVVLGTVLGAPSCFPRVQDSLQGHDFFLPAHAVTWDAIEALASRQEPPGLLQVVDSLRLAAELRRFERGEADLLAMVTSNPGAWSPLFESAVRMVAEKSALRGIITACADAVGRARNGEGASGEVVDDLQASLVKLRMRGASDAQRIAGPLRTFLTELELRKETPELRGVPSGIARLDSYTGGFLNGQLVVVAARPGQGKTAFALNVCRRMVLAGGAALFVSLEMTVSELVERLVAQETQTDSVLLRRGQGLTIRHWTEFHDMERRYQDAALYIADDVQTPAQVASVVRRFRARHPQQKAIAAVDYLQLMRLAGNKGASRAELVGEVSAGLKRLAKSCAMPILELSQLNRSSEHETRAPRLSDLRDSGAIEQDADVVLFPYNPNKVVDGTVEIVLGKNRNGATGTLNAHWTGHTYTFSDSNAQDDQEDDWQNGKE